MQSPPGARTLINGRWRDYFSGTGYLGLQGHPGLLAAASEALLRYGLTTATSRGGYGEHPLFTAVESAAARYWGTDGALYFVSGYLGNAILLQGLAGDYDRIFVDESSHFSAWDAARAAGLRVHAFRHRDATHLATVMRRRLRPGERPLLLTDGVFPISGEIAPLPDYFDVLHNYPGARICLDDAHATGVLGPHGHGTLDHWLGGGTGDGNLGDLRAFVVSIFSAHTLSKAMGGHGGVIPGDAALIERLNRGPIPGAGSPSPLPAAAASAWALNYLSDHLERRSRLQENVKSARAALRQAGWALEDSPVPILCLHAGNWDGDGPVPDLSCLQQQLFERDICVAHVTRYSSTPPGGALRVAVFATHTRDQINRLGDVCGSLVKAPRARIAS
jgi:glycine C-acetyltransferase/8-amino-7-oxononanoate synthase